MTEDKAAQMMCPMLWQSSVIIAAAFNRVGQLESKTHHCVGSACMMWRQTDLIQELRNDPTKSEKVLHKQQVGYCGLAGKP